MMNFLHFVPLWDAGLMISVLIGLIGTLMFMRLTKYRGFKLPPGPRGYPLIGNVLDFNGKAKHAVCTEWSKTYGPVLSFYMGTQLFVVLNNIEVAMEAFVEKKSDFVGRPRNVTIDLVTGGGKTVAFNEGSMWAFQRKSSIKALRPLIAGEALDRRNHESIQKVFSKLECEQRPVDSRQYIAWLIVHILCGICFGKSYDLEDKEFGKIVHSMQAIEALGEGINAEDIFPFLRYCPTPKLRKFLKEERIFYHIIESIVQKHKNTFNPDNIEDFTDGILLEKHELENNGTKMNEEFTNGHLIHTILDVFEAGVNTTISIMHFALRYMATYPEVQRKAHKEVDTAIGTDRLPRTSDREFLPYTEAITKEVLRIHPAGPLGLPFRTVCNTSIGGYDIPEDTGVLLNIWALQHDQEHWDKPNEFIPERFLTDECKVTTKSKCWLPFGIGKRQCLGKAFAETQLVILLASFLQIYNVQFPNGEQQNMGYDVGIFTMRATPFKLSFIKR